MNEKSVRRIDLPELQGGMNRQHRVRQIIEPGHWRESDPFLMLAEDWFVRGTFGDHPHRGFETITLVLEGSVEHADNHGGRGVLQPGDAQWMTAGRGVVHSEEAGADGAHSLQLWVNLPRALKMSEPRYQDLRATEMPVRREPGAELRVYSGTSGDVTSPTRTHLPITMIDVRLDAGATITQELPPHDNTFIYVLSGSATFGAEQKPAHDGHVVWLERGDDEASSLTITAETPLRAILWSGSPIGEPVAAYGPFVTNTVGEIKQAFDDFQSGRF